MILIDEEWASDLVWISVLDPRFFRRHCLEDSATVTVVDAKGLLNHFKFKFSMKQISLCAIEVGKQNSTESKPNQNQINDG